MGTYTTRLGCQLSFSEEQESDIIEVIKQLNSTHSMGQFVSNLIRIALENPEIINKGNGRFEQGALMKHMNKCGISYDRKKFMQTVTKDISDMKKKIDAIYDLAMKTYTLGLMGKHLGIEEKSDNELLSAFILERQLKDLQTSLGVSIADSTYASNKIDTEHKKAEETLEYIIETYSGIVDELKKKLEVTQIPVQTIAVQPVQPVQQVQQITPETVTVGQPTIAQPTVSQVTIVQPTVGQHTIAQPTVGQPTVGQVTETVTQANEDAIDFGLSASTHLETATTVEEDQVVDFANADEDALTNFFGLS